MSLREELGPRKYREKIEESNKLYDKYKAGKVDPKTGEYYNPISFNDPNKSKIGNSASIGYFECQNPACNEVFSINRNTVCVICSKCKTLNYIKR